MRKVLVVLFCITVLAFFTLACDGAEEATKVGTADEATETASEGSGETAATTYAVGDVVAIGDWQVTVNSVRRVPADDFNTPDEGNIYIAVDMTVENTSAEAGAFSSLMQLTLKDAEGYSYDQEIFLDLQGIAEGEMAPGEKSRGEVGYQVPEAATGLMLNYDAELLGSGKIVWNLGDAASIQ